MMINDAKQKNKVSYIICKLSTWMLYNVVEYNDINMLVLLLGLMFLNDDHHVVANRPYTFEDLKNCLYTTGELISEVQDLKDCNTGTELDLEHQIVRIISSFTQIDDNISNLLEIFPEYTKEELKQHEYRMSVDNYLEILEKFLNFYATKVPYIILYEDDNKIVHCEEYFPTEEEKASNWKAIPNNQAK